jgi:UPF0271 protein
MIELNADIGEGWDDAALLPYLARASIACGGHAGDEASMRAALDAAAAHGVLPGAHPAYPDRPHFGRRALAATPADIEGWVLVQIETLARHAHASGIRLAHVKPHGALYNVSARDPAVAAAVVRAVMVFDPQLAVLGLAGSALVDAARRAGLAVLNEAFADRRYRDDGALVSRETPGAVLADPLEAAAQALALAAGDPVTTFEGGAMRITADTLCLHSDTPNAAAIAQAVHAALYRG